MIFLDSPSTTPLDASVLDAMLPYMRKAGPDGRLLGQAERSGSGPAARAARESVSELIKCLPNEIVWTSGATEANNLAILGFAAHREKPGRIVSQVTEHSAVLEPLRHLEKRGWDIELLPVNKVGGISIDALLNATSRDTDLVSIMWGNNEIGTVQPIAEIAELCADRGITFHCDAAQAVGKVPIDLTVLPITTLTLSAHKFYGPVGAGALFVRDLAKQQSVSPLMFGGGQEHGIRPGTLNLPAIVGLGAASRLVCEQMEAWAKHTNMLRTIFEAGLQKELAEISVNGDVDNRLPHISNLAFPGTDSEGLLTIIPNLIASTGSACHYADFNPSHVLTALNKLPRIEDCSLRFGFHKDSTVVEIESAVALIVEAVDHYRSSC